jgi:hypothetical protein
MDLIFGRIHQGNPGSKRMRDQNRIDNAQTIAQDFEIQSVFLDAPGTAHQSAFTETGEIKQSDSEPGTQKILSRLKHLDILTPSVQADDIAPFAGLSIMNGYAVDLKF